MFGVVWGGQGNPSKDINLGKTSFFLFDRTKLKLHHFLEDNHIKGKLYFFLWKLKASW